jgi:hypothetical protein
VAGVTDHLLFSHNHSCRGEVLWRGACLSHRAKGRHRCAFLLIKGALPQLRYMSRVGQNRVCTPYMTVLLAISLPKVPYIHRIYMVLANPIYEEPGRSR